MDDAPDVDDGPPLSDEPPFDDDPAPIDLDGERGGGPRRGPVLAGGGGGRAGRAGLGLAAHGVVAAGGEGEN